MSVTPPTSLSQRNKQYLKCSMEGDGLANQLSDISGYIQDIYLRNNLSQSVAQRLVTSLIPSITRSNRDNTSKRPERGCLRFPAFHFDNYTDLRKFKEYNTTQIVFPSRFVAEK